jgi:YVTN family beta-propeller protein/VCBS repeat-containing protein
VTALLDVEATPAVAALPVTVVGSTPAPLTIVDGVPVVNAPTKFVATVLGFLGFNPFADNAGGTPTPSPALVFAWGLWQQINRRVFNSHPVLSPSEPTTNSDGTVSGSLGASDPDQDVLTYTLVTAPEHGTVVINPDGTYVYTPDADYARELSASGGGAGSDSFTVSVSDDTAVNGSHLHWLSATAESSGTSTVAVTITPTNTDPVLSVSSSPSGASTVYTVSRTDADDDAVTVSASTPAHGSIVDNGDGTWTYTPNLDYAHGLSAGGSTVAGSDVIVFSAADGHGGGDEVTVTPVIAPANADPTVHATSTANSDGTTTYVLTPVDADGDVTTIAISPEPQHGSLTVITDAAGGPMIIYVPDPTYSHALAEQGSTLSMTDAFTVDIDDGHGGLTSTTLTPAITPANVGPTATSTVQGSPVTAATSYSVWYTPRGVAAISPDGKTYYVANIGNSTVTIVNIATGLKQTSTVGSEPAYIALSPDGTRAYVTNYSTVSVINTLTGRTIGPEIPVGSDTYGVQVTPDGKYVYVASRSTGSVSVINTSTAKVVQSIPVSAVYGLAITPSGDRVYVTNMSSVGTVSVIDADPTHATYNTVVATIPVGASPSEVAIGPDGTRAYVVNETSGTVSVIDTDPVSVHYNTVIATIALGSSPTGVAVSPDGSRAYVAVNGANRIAVIDTGTNKVLGTVAVTAPRSMAVSPDGTTLLVSSSWGSTSAAVAIPTGVVHGAVTGADADGDTVTYSLATAPTKGSVVLDQTTGTWTYTSTVPGTVDADSFVVAVSDGHGGTTTVPVAVGSGASTSV